MILGKSVVPCEGEVSVKSYQCTEFRSWIFGIKAKGYVEVTNKRLLFQALGKNLKGWSAIHNEVAITDVAEIKIYNGTSFSFLIFLLGLLISIILSWIINKLISNFSPNMGFFIAFIAFCYFVFRSYLWARKPAFSLIIDTKGGQGNVVRLAALSPFSVANSAVSKALVARPSTDSMLIMEEIGALIMDIQSMGDYGIEKWRSKAKIQ